jgi:CheY-like chemotaxis protein
MPLLVVTIVVSEAEGGWKRCSSRTDPLHKPTILVVEDEFLIRLDAVDRLEEAGFEVIEAGDADEAIRILETGAEVRILFTDVDMPGSMDGFALARIARDRWPPIEIIVASGQRRPEQSALPDRGQFFGKPYDWPELVSALQKITE